MTFLVRRFNMLYEERTHKKQAETNKPSKIQFC
jgi:hypothetical protein